MRGESNLGESFSKEGRDNSQAICPTATDYLEDMKGGDYDSLEDREKIELLEALFIIMKSFVDIGHNLDPVNKLIAEFENTDANPPLMIDCEDATDEE